MNPFRTFKNHASSPGLFDQCGITNELNRIAKPAFATKQNGTPV